MAAYSFNYVGSKITAQLNVTNLFNRTYYPSESNYAPLMASSGQPLLFMSSFRTYGAPFAVMGTLRAELDKGATLTVAAAGPHGLAVAALLYLDRSLRRRPDRLRRWRQRGVG